MLFVTLLLHLYLLIQISQSAKDLDDDSNETPEGRRSQKRLSRGEYLDGCGKYFPMGLSRGSGEKKKVRFFSANFGHSENYFHDTFCSWTFLGSRHCIPEIKCSEVDLRTDVTDKLVITDALGGKLVVTEKSDLLTTPHRASGGGRDLFVRFVVDKAKKFNRQHKGFSCTVTCTKPTANNSKLLPSNGIVKKEEYKCICGMQGGGSDQRVVGGEDAVQNEFPWQVALVHPGTREAFCGGSIINNQYILTATHCFWFSKKQAHEIEVLIHAHVLDFTITSDDANISIPLGQEASMQSPGYDLPIRTDKEEKSQRFKVTKIIQHPLFTEMYDFDAALLRLDRKINLVGEDAPTPVCLPNINNIRTSYDGETPIVSGWGLADELAGASTRLLQKLKVPVIPHQSCNKVLPEQISERMICAGFLKGVKDACTGDSGGPLTIVLNSTKQTQQIGIVSWGEGCARKDRPGVYARVTEFLQWIYHHANSAKVTWCRSAPENATATKPKG